MDKSSRGPKSKPEVAKRPEPRGEADCQRDTDLPGLAALRASLGAAGSSDDAQAAALRSMSPTQRATTMRELNTAMGNTQAGRVASAAASTAPAKSTAPRRPVVPAARKHAVQAKLRVGAETDSLEREADDLADALMRSPVFSDPRSGDEPVRDQAGPENPGPPAWTYASGAGQQFGLEVPDDLEGDILALEASGSPLAASERAFFEPRLGVDLGELRVHTGPEAAALCDALAAHAFAFGRHIVLGSDTCAADPAAARRLMAHELVHVMQQGALPGGGKALPQQVSSLVQRSVKSGDDDFVAVIAGPKTGTLHVVRLNKKREIVAPIANVTPPKGVPLNEAAARVQAVTKLNKDKTKVEIRLPPGYTFTTQTRHQVDIRNEKVEEIARRDADYKRANDFLREKYARDGITDEIRWIHELDSPEKISALLAGDDFKKYTDTLYWREVAKMLQQKRDQIRAGTSGDFALSDDDVDRLWGFDKDAAASTWDEKNKTEEKGISALQQFEKMNQTALATRKRMVEFADAQSWMESPTTYRGMSQQGEMFAALAGRDLPSDDAVTRAINKQIRENKGNLFEFAQNEANWVYLKYGADSPQAKRWKLVLDGYAALPATSGFRYRLQKDKEIEAQKVEQAKDREDADLYAWYMQQPGAIPGATIAEIRAFYRMHRRRSELSPWEQAYLDRHGDLPNEVVDPRGHLLGYKVYEIEALGLGGGVGQVTEKVVNVSGKVMSEKKTVILSPALDILETVIRQTPYLGDAVGLLEAVGGMSLSFKDMYTEGGRELSAGERIDALLTSIPGFGKLGKVAHVAGQIAKYKTIIGCVVGVSLNGADMEALLQGKPRYMDVNERAYTLIHMGVMHYGMQGVGAVARVAGSMVNGGPKPKFGGASAGKPAEVENLGDRAHESLGANQKMTANKLELAALEGQHRVAIKVNDAMGDGISVKFEPPDKYGLVGKIEVHIGPDAVRADFARHLQIVYALRQYQGAAGITRVAMDTVKGRLGMKVAGPGTEAFALTHEINKLRDEMVERVGQLDILNAEGRAKALQQIKALRDQMTEHQQTARSPDWHPFKIAMKKTTSDDIAADMAARGKPKVEDAATPGEDALARARKFKETQRKLREARAQVRPVLDKPAGAPGAVPDRSAGAKPAAVPIAPSAGGGARAPKGADGADHYDPVLRMERIAARIRPDIDVPMLDRREYGRIDAQISAAARAVARRYRFTSVQTGINREAVNFYVAAFANPGYRAQITVYKGIVIEGHHRLIASEIAGKSGQIDVLELSKPPPYHNMGDNVPVAFGDYEFNIRSERPNWYKKGDDNGGNVAPPVPVGPAPQGPPAAPAAAATAGHDRAAVPVAVKRQDTGAGPEIAQTPRDANAPAPAVAAGGVTGGPPVQVGGDAGGTPVKTDGNTGALPVKTGGSTGTLPVKTGGNTGALPVETGGTAGAPARPGKRRGRKAPAVDTGGSPAEAPAVSKERLDALKKRLTPEEVETLEGMRGKKTDKELIDWVEATGDPEAFVRRAAADKLKKAGVADAQAAAAAKRDVEARAELAKPQFKDRPEVQAVIAKGKAALADVKAAIAQGKKAVDAAELALQGHLARLRGMMAEEISATMVRDMAVAKTPGAQVHRAVKVYREVIDMNGLTIDDWMIKNRSQHPIREGNKAYLSSGEIDTMVTVPSTADPKVQQLAYLEEVKSGINDTHNKASGQLKRVLEAFADVADGNKAAEGRVVVRYANGDSALDLDFSPAKPEVAKARLVSPAEAEAKGYRFGIAKTRGLLQAGNVETDHRYDTTHGMTQADLEKLAREFIAGEGSK